MNIKEKLNDIKNKLTRIQKKQSEDSQKTTVAKKTEYTDEEKRMLEGIRTFREGTPSPAATAIADYFARIRNVSLDAKVDDYIKWNYENMVKGKYTPLGEHRVPIDLRNFIEKMAVWYELRYPDYEINRRMPGSGQEGISVSNEMFNTNSYVNELLDENSDIRALDWDEFYNTDAFISSLPWEEKYRFNRVRYRDIVYLDPNYSIQSEDKIKGIAAHLHLTSRGIVEEAEGFDLYTNNAITNEQLEGMRVEDVLSLLREKNITLPEDSEIIETVKNAENWKKQREGLLDAVMYRIIERGGNRMGPRRGFLFAKEFGRNIDIPMMYAIDRTDPGLRRFINEYLKAGGSKDLMCYIGYFSRTNQMEELNTISIRKLLLKQANDALTFYTPEETELHQRIVDTLASQIDEDELKKQKVKQLRIIRKLNKIKNKK